MTTAQAQAAVKNLYNSGTVMPDGEFQRFRGYIYDKCGVNLTSVKKTMLTLRLFKRMRALGISSFGGYYDYVLSPKGQEEELIHMIDVVTTNKTDFFREPKHFDFLSQTALPALLQNGRLAKTGKLSIWSAGCSSGEEPYTLAMVVQEFFTNQGTGDFSILATDISTRVLEIGRQGIYGGEAIRPVPASFKPKYLMKGKGSRKGFFRIVPELRNRIHFQRLNLNDGPNFGLRGEFDLIFCRNVVIYFDRETQKRLFKKFYDQLVPGGFMFIGHSETLHGIFDHFRPVSVSVYRKPG